MVFRLRNGLAVAGFYLLSSLAQAQTSPTAPAPVPTPLPVAPAPTVIPPTTAPLTAPLLRPNGVKGNYKTYLNQRYATDKEARAVVHLFSRKQTGGALWLISGVGFISFVASQTGTTTSSSGTTTVNVTPLGYAILVGLFGGVGVGKVARFNNQKLFEALMAHDQGQGFPGYVESRLKDKDYK